MGRSGAPIERWAVTASLCALTLCGFGSRSDAGCWSFTEVQYPDYFLGSGVCADSAGGCAGYPDCAFVGCTSYEYYCPEDQNVYQGGCICSQSGQEVDCEFIDPNGLNYCYDSCCYVPTTFTFTPSVCPSVCGDGLVQCGEQCDDGNITGGDGCSAGCAIEAGWSCTGQPSVCTPGCGDGKVQGSEQCDDGNNINGDCCSSTCQFEAKNSPCDDHNACTTNDSCDGAGTCVGGPAPNCDDGNLCTQDSCNSVTGCVHDATPVSGCKTPGKSVVLLKGSADNTKDELTWKWLKGAATMPTELGVPTGTTNYALCVYAGTAVATIDLPAGSTWQAAGTSGFKFKDPTGTPDGAQIASLKSGGAGKAKALVKGKGANLPDDVVPALPLPVTVQLVNDSNNACFEAVYSSTVKNDAKEFKAKTP